MSDATFMLIVGISILCGFIGSYIGRFPLSWRINRLEQAILSEQRQRANGARQNLKGNVAAAAQSLGLPFRHTTTSLEEVERRAMAGDDSGRP